MRRSRRDRLGTALAGVGLITGLLTGIVTTAPAAAAASPTWSTAGPGPGWANAVAVDPSNRATAYLGTAYGVYKTTDNGASWTVSGTGMPLDRVRALTVDPTAPTRVWAGTDGSGLWASDDAGATWHEALDTGGRRVWGIGASGNAVVVAADPNVYVTSFDGGTTWSGSNELEDADEHELHVTGAAVGADGAMYVTTWDGGLFAGSAFGLSHVDFGPPTSLFSVAVDAAGDVVVGGTSSVWGRQHTDTTWSQIGSVSGPARAVAFDGGTTPSVYAGTTTGIVRIGGSPPSSSLGPDAPVYGVGVLAPAVAGGSPRLVATTLEGGALVGDGSGPWIPASGGPGTEISAVVDGTDPATSTHFLLAGGANGFVYGLTDTSGGWQRRTTSPLPSGGITALLWVPTTGRVYASTANTIYRSVDFGSTWTPIVTGTYAVWQLIADPADGTTIYGASQMGQVLKITDGGGPVTSSVGTGLPSENIFSVAADPAGPLYASTQSRGVYKSNDHGLTWAATTTSTSNPQIRSVAVDASTSPTTLWAGTGDGHAGYSTDGGSTFQDASTGLSGAWGDEVHVTARGGVVAAGVSSTSAPPTSGGALTFSAGAWTALDDSGLLDHRIRQVVIDERSTPANLVLDAATPAGVFTAGAPASTPPPPPSLTGIAPASTPVCTSGCADVTVTLTGTGFDGTAVAEMIDSGSSTPTPLTTNVSSSTSLTATIPGVALGTARTVQLDVTVPATGTSNALPFFVTATSATVQAADTATSDGSGPAVASTGSLTATATGGSGAVSVATYSGDPVVAPAPTGASSFIDVYVAPGSTFTSLSVVDCQLDPNNTSHLVYFWDGGQWLPVSNQTYDSGSGCVTMTFDRTSAPQIGQLVGTVFADTGGVSRSLSTGPTNLEGVLTIRAGDWIAGGYHFKLSSRSSSAVTVTVHAARLRLPITCGNGTQTSVTVPLADRTYTVPAGATGWVPTNDPDTPEGFQGSVQAVDVCGGSGMRNKVGATFTGTVTTTGGRSLSIGFHYRDPAAKGKPNTDCSSATANPAPGTSACSTSWSSPVTV